MKRQSKMDADFTKLREQAEERLGIRVGTHQLWTEADIHKQYHELQVAQIELELQNTELIELRNAKKEIETGLARYTDLYDSSPLGYFTVARDTTVIEANLTGAKLLGLERHEIIGRHLRTLITPKFRGPLETFQARVFASHQPEFCELEFMKAGKRRFFAQVEAHVDDTGQKCFTVIKDITARRIVSESLRTAHSELETRVRERTTELVRANEELEQTKRMLRQLAIHQDTIKEAERKRIAREIHDELGQNLLALRIDVSLLHARTGISHPKLHERVGEALRQLDVAMTSVRSIINDLRPNVLDLGLPAAIEWQAKEFGRRTGIQCDVQMDERNFTPDLDGNLALAFFRILQESLSNITRHSHASRVVIELHNDGNVLKMKVADNGIGISCSDIGKKENSFGLVGIKERVVTLSGELHIDGSHGQGTALTVSIPLEPPAHKRPGFIERRQY
jgi:PAS domain S-box-containing protein